MAIQNQHPTNSSLDANHTESDSCATERVAPLMFSPTSLVEMGLFETEAPQEPR